MMRLTGRFLVGPVRWRVKSLTKGIEPQRRGSPREFRRFGDYACTILPSYAGGVRVVVLRPLP